MSLRERQRAQRDEALRSIKTTSGTTLWVAGYMMGGRHERELHNEPMKVGNSELNRALDERIKAAAAEAEGVIYHPPPFEGEHSRGPGV